MIATLPAANDSGAFPADIEHPSGVMRVLAAFDKDNNPERAGVIRTTRMIMSGEVYPPE